MINFKHALFNGTDVECNIMAKPDDSDELKKWVNNIEVLEFESQNDKEIVKKILKRRMGEFAFFSSISFGVDVSSMVYKKDNLLYFKSSIKITKNTGEQVTFEKGDVNEPWFNNDCSNDNLLKILGREKDTIARVQFDDGTHIGSILYIYFEKKDLPKKDPLNIRHSLPLTNQKLWEMAKLITDRQKKAKEQPTDKVDWNTLEDMWFDWLEEQLLLGNDDNVAPKPTWDAAFEEADKYAQKQDAKDRAENNIQESGYWFWFKDCLKKRFVINRVGRIDGV